VDFWRTHPTEFWWVVDAKLEAAERNKQTNYAGGMSEAEVADLYEWCMSED
jgi:hypothetical protein